MNKDVGKKSHKIRIPKPAGKKEGLVVGTPKASIAMNHVCKAFGAEIEAYEKFLSFATQPQQALYFDVNLLRAFCELLSIGIPRRYAAEVIGLLPRTVRVWLGDVTIEEHLIVKRDRLPRAYPDSEYVTVRHDPYEPDPVKRKIRRRRIRKSDNEAEKEGKVELQIYGRMSSSAGFFLVGRDIWMRVKGHGYIPCITDAAREFAGSAIQKAEALFVAENIATIREAAKDKWQASAWLLERSKPEEFSLRMPARGGGGKEGNQPVTIRVVTLVPRSEDAHRARHLVTTGSEDGPSELSRPPVEDFVPLKDVEVEVKELPAPKEKEDEDSKD